MKMGLTTVADCRPARREELYTRPQLRQREESLRDIADTQEQASAPARAYVNGTTYFNHADWLGTERARSNVSGTRCETITSLPFGDGQVISSSCGDPSPDHFTGKERDTESGFDYFPNRYLTSTLGRWITPDPLMASAEVWDPQTWNRYSYAHNNPLMFIDPTGMAEVTAFQCAQDKNCVTVNVNVIYDKNSNDGTGLTDKQKADFEKGQLQNAKDQYGDADIHLNVTYTEGALSTDNRKTHVSGLQAGALNVVVTDQVATAVSGMAGKTAVSLINPNSADKEELPHEMAHHFMGDTQGWRSWIMTHDPIISGKALNAFTDIGNDVERAWMRNLDRHSGAVELLSASQCIPSQRSAVSEIDSADDKTTMIIFRVIFRLLRRGLILLLGTYWVTFVGYTIKNLVASGPGAVVVWYRHIAGAAFQWDWRVFLAQQVLTLAITVLLCLFERRTLIKERRTSDQSANRTSKV